MQKYLTSKDTEILIELAFITSTLYHLNSFLYVLTQNESYIEAATAVEYCCSCYKNTGNWTHTSFTPLAPSPAVYRHIHVNLCTEWPWSLERTFGGVPTESPIRSGERSLLHQKPNRLPSADDRDFAIAATQLWNWIPYDLKKCQDTYKFKSMLKAHLIGWSYTI